MIARNPYQNNLLLLCALWVFALCHADSSLAADNIPTETLPTVTVEATRIAPMTGATVLDRELIRTLPNKNGTINETLSIVPGVQYSETANNSYTSGEITPSNLSISGSHFYENNFTIDGINNNSAIEPANTEVFQTSVLSGHPQKIHLDPHLVESVTVFDSNISAEHGGFTGGQVEVKTLDPVDEFWGNINYRTTRDKWTKFHIASENYADFIDSNTDDRQPKFRKHDGGFTLNVPIGLDMGLLTSYQRLQSTIPLRHFNESRNQKRLSENFFLKYGYHITNAHKLYVTAALAPYEARYFYPDVKDSDFTLKGDNNLLSVQSQHKFTSGKLDFSLAYSEHRVIKDAPKDRFRWDFGGSIDWGGPTFSDQGAYGDLEQRQNDIQFNADYAPREYVAGRTSHLLKVGVEARHSAQKYIRAQTSYFYYPFVDNGGAPINCQAGDAACIENEQFATRRQIFEAGQSSAELLTLSAYIQDSIAWKRLEVFPGVRLSRDDYLKNTNVAPRLATSYDIFGSGKSILFGGRNRYYSGTLLTFKLREAISPLGRSENRSITGNTPDPWPTDLGQPPTNEGTYVDRSSQLKTPYADELTIGLRQKLWGGELSLQYIERKGRDELTRERDSVNKVYFLKNNGRSHHESYQISWKRSRRKSYFELNGTYQETETSHLSYTDLVSVKDTTDLIFYDGDFLRYDQIPKKDFSRPITVNAVYSVVLPLGISFTNTTKFRSAYTTLTRKKPLVSHGPQPNSANAFDLIYEFEKIRMHSALIFDWGFSWKLPTQKPGSTKLTLDIFNVFNEKAYIANNDDEFELGQQIWAGIEIDF